MATKARNLTDFMAENDKDTILRSKIQKRLNELLKLGPEQHETERDFAVSMGVNGAELARTRPEFAKHIAFVPRMMGRKERYVWFADPRKVPAKFRYTPSQE